MAATMKSKMLGGSHDVYFDGALLSETRGSLVVELIKYLLYERQQIPVPFDDLKKLHEPAPDSCTKENDANVVNSRMKNMFSFGSKLPTTKSVQQQKTDSTIASLTNLFEQIRKTFEKCPEIEQVAVVFGSTVMTPKESYVINFPPPCADADHIPFASCKRILFRQIFEQDILGALGKSLPPTNMSVILSAPRSCPVSWFLPKMSLAAPKRGTVTTFNLCCSYTVPVSSELTFNGGDWSIISGIELLDCALCHNENVASERKTTNNNDLTDISEEGNSQCQQPIPCEQQQFTSHKSSVSSSMKNQQSSSSSSLVFAPESMSTPMTFTKLWGYPLARCPHSEMSRRSEKKGSAASGVLEEQTLSQQLSQLDIAENKTVSEDCIWYQSPLVIKGLKIA